MNRIDKITPSDVNAVHGTADGKITNRHAVVMCGKSYFAEKLFNGFECRKIYIATIQHYGKEAFSAIELNRKLRNIA